jgi:type III secretory pathway component EscR
MTAKKKDDEAETEIEQRTSRLQRGSESCQDFLREKGHSAEEIFFGKNIHEFLSQEESEILTAKKIKKENS